MLEVPGVGQVFDGGSDGKDQVDGEDQDQGEGDVLRYGLGKVGISGGSIKDGDQGIRN